MFSFLFRAIILALVAGAGWVIGSVYPAPAALIARINPQAIEMQARERLGQIDWARIRAITNEDQLSALSAAAVQEAASTGRAIVVEYADVGDAGSNDSYVGVETPEDAAPPVTTAASHNVAFETALALCPGMSVSNAPRTDAQRRVAGFTPTVNVSGVALAVNPTQGACLSSGFGPRGSRQHKGIDFHAATGGPILAAADGTIVEMKYRDDYGNMLLIDHGHGVYTRYAHLSSFQRGLAVGGAVKAGDQIGLMGNTASYPVPIHLHYEVLLGDYNTPRQSFGLTPHNPFIAT